MVTRVLIQAQSVSDALCKMVQKLSVSIAAYRCFALPMLERTAKGVLDAAASSNFVEPCLLSCSSAIVSM